jgi:hypothetical protein
LIGDCFLAIENNMTFVVEGFEFGGASFPPKLQEVPHFFMGGLGYFAALSAIWLPGLCNLVSARVYQAGI